MHVSSQPLSLFIFHFISFYFSFLLDEPQAQQAIGKLSKDLHSFDIFMCWIDMLEFKQIPASSSDYRYSKIVDIYHKYIKKNAILEIGGNLLTYLALFIVLFSYS